MNLMAFNNPHFRSAKNILYLFLVDIHHLEKKTQIIAKLFENADIHIVKRPFDDLGGNYPNVTAVDIDLNFPVIPREARALDGLLKQKKWDAILIQGMGASFWADPYQHFNFFPSLYEPSRTIPVCYLTDTLNMVFINEEISRWRGPVELDDGFAIDCPGHMTGGELSCLADLARQRPESGLVVEIGRFWGRSTIALAHVLKGSGSGKLVSIDLYEQPRFREILSSHGLSEYVEVWNGFSKANYSRWEASMPDEKPGLVFVDGNHTYESAYMDILQWSRLLPPEGILVVDDYDECNVGVMLAVNELMAWSGNFHSLEQKGKLFVGRKKAG